jgi:drug/metabolite transporter (DMT)-like permease
MGHADSGSLALASSVTGGVSDFLSGTTSRRIGTLWFMFWTQLVQLALAIGWVAISGDEAPGVGTIAIAAGAGLGLTIGLTAFFQAMVVGKISIVAPLSATGVAIPVAAGLIGGEHPDATQIVGIAVTACGAVLAARGPREPESPGPESGVLLAFLAALGGGVFFWLGAIASHHSAAWTVLVARVVPSIVLASAVVLGRAGRRRPIDRREASRMLAAALLGFAGLALYAAATLHGALAIVSVLAALYPVVTVLLALRVLGERMQRSQQVGILAVLGGVVLLSA